jgi:hypothetical protein
MTLLKLSLHLDEFELGRGGGWSFYDPADELLSTEVYLDLGRGDMTPGELAGALIAMWVVACDRQYPLAL